MNDELTVYSCLTNDYQRVVIIKCYEKVLKLDLTTLIFSHKQHSLHYIRTFRTLIFISWKLCKCKRSVKN